MSVISPLAYRGYSANFSSISDSVKLAIDDGLLVVFTAQRYASAVYAMASVCVFACVCVCVSVCHKPVFYQNGYSYMAYYYAKDTTQLRRDSRFLTQRFMVKFQWSHPY